MNHHQQTILMHQAQQAYMLQLYKMMYQMCLLHSFFSLAATEKSVSRLKKIATNPNQKKPALKSLMHQGKLDASTKRTIEVTKGRMYDYNNARFLSVDPFITGTSSQAINPYTYIFNNPLSGIDPTGYVPAGIEEQMLFGNIPGPNASVEEIQSFNETEVVLGALVIVGILTIDQVSDYVAPIKGLAKKAIKEGFKAVKNGVQKALKNGNNNKNQGSTASQNKNLSDTESIKEQRKATLAANKQKGAEFEKETVKQERKNLDDIEEQVTIKTKSGTRTRVDCVGSCKKTGETKLVEAKSSKTAPLTTNQKKAFPEIEKSGGTVVGKGKGKFKGGTKIPAQKVKTVRPCEKGGDMCQ